VDELRDDADKLFEAAQVAEEAKDVETAERLYRKVMRIDPGDFGTHGGLATDTDARVLRPGGELRFYEHVRSPHHWIGRGQDLLTPVWRRAFGACHPNRDTLAAIQTSGFDIANVDTFGFGPRPLTMTHILGSAHRG